MKLNKSIPIEPQIELLIDNGWYEDAKNCVQLSFQHGIISKEAHDRFALALAGKPASAHPGHELYGGTVGFDSNTVLSSLQFRRLTSVEDMKKAFKQAVNKIEIEPSTQCNRRCTYCPNSAPAFAHRLTKNEFFDMDMLEDMLLDLQEIDYDKKIALVGLNEFFMHEENFKYAEMIKEMLPKSYLQVFSNGDYIDQDMLERAERSGVDLLVVSFHPQAGKPYDAAEVLDRTAKFMKRTNLQLTITDYRKGERLHMQTRMGKLQIMAGLVNWETHGHNWGGSLDCGREMAEPEMPCESPVNVLCLAQNGDFTLCCNVPRERTAENVANGAMLGNLKDFPSIFHAYASDTMLYWRQHSFSTKKIPELCQNCSARNTDWSRANKPIAEFIEQQGVGYVQAPNPPAFKRAVGE
jgi:hypothetical protein